MYERGITLFKYPHVGDIWHAYIHHFVQRYGGKKVERVRDMFEEALQQVAHAVMEMWSQSWLVQAPEEFAKPLYLQYAKFEEDHGLAKHAMTIYAKAAHAVPIDQRMGVYNVYLARAMDFFGISKVCAIA